MSDAATKDSRGVQAYRWWIGAGVGLVCFLSAAQFNQLSKFFDKVDELQKQVIKLEGTVDGVKTVVDSVKGQMETRFNDHQRQINGVAGRTDRQANQLEELQRQQWQRR